MRKLSILAISSLGLAAAAVAPASSALADTDAPVRPALISDGVYNPADAPLLQKTDFFWGGRNYCWYDDGWRGPGWYWCGYAFNYGWGWGGPWGWHGWRDRDDFRFRDRDDRRGFDRGHDRGFGWGGGDHWRGGDGGHWRGGDRGGHGGGGHDHGGGRGGHDGGHRR